MAQSTVCVLASGGVDSAILTWYLARDGSQVQPVYVQAGMTWEAAERRWLERFLEAIGSPAIRPVHVLSFPLGDVYASHWSVGGAGAPDFDAPDEAAYLPGRNVVLLSKTAVYCALNGIERIAQGVLAGNPFPDATDRFFDTLAEALSAGLGCRLQVERPFGAMDKVDVVRLGAHLPLHLTFSCVQPVGESHCGACNKCAERQRGFREAGVPDLTVYVRPAA